jgi:small-conductance mechanosensitive channel
MIGPVHGNGIVANMQEQPGMAALATQNQALVQENQALKKQQAAMQQLFQQMAKQNERLAAVNAGGSTMQLKGAELLGEKVNALTEANELLRQENTLLKAQQEEVNAQHADETQQKNGRIVRLERRIAELEAKQQACQEFFQTVRTVSTSDFIIQSTTDGLNQTLKSCSDYWSPYTLNWRIKDGRVKAESADALVLAVAKVQQDLLDICNQYRE